MPSLSVEHSRYGLRETTEGLPRLLPELRFAGHVLYHTARPSFFQQHQHPDILEIFHVVRGKVSWRVEGVCSDIVGDEIFLIWPGELHGAKNDIVEPGEYYWIQVHLPSLNRSETSKLARPFRHPAKTRAVRQFRGTPALLPLFRSLLEEQTSREPDRLQILRATLHLLLSLVARSARQSTSARTTQHPDEKYLGRAMAWAEEHLAEATVGDLARASGLDESRFRRSFISIFGSPPSRYLLRLRLQHAKADMIRGLNVTSVAHKLGFASSQHFATVFRKYEGMSPTDWVENANLP